MGGIGCVIAQVVSHQPLNAKTQVCAWASLCGICGRQSVTGASFSLTSSVFPCQYHSTVALHTQRSEG
jgi:hypothetical protein